MNLNQPHNRPRYIFAHIYEPLQIVPMMLNLQLGFIEQRAVALI